MWHQADVNLGILCAIALSALICFALWRVSLLVRKASAEQFTKVVAFLTILLIIKMVALLHFQGFFWDVDCYTAWSRQMALGGPASMYQPHTDGHWSQPYTPGYMYALWVVGILVNATGVSGDVQRMMIGTPALLADFALGLTMFALVWRLAGKAAAWGTLLFFALNPALLFDTVVWMQSDSAYTFLMLLSLAMLIQEEFAVAWGLAALASLTKPQAFSLLPILLVWTLLRSDWKTWIRSGLAAIAVAAITIMPFQLVQPWDWLPKLYLSTAAYNHETSVNAFNLMALLGGLRAPDDGLIFGWSYLSIGLALLVLLYGSLLCGLSRAPTPRNLLFAAFLAAFGCFLFAPRMHERYLYAALVLAIPLAFESPVMFALFLALTLTFLVNLAYVLHYIEYNRWLDTRDSIAMVISTIDVAVFLRATSYWWKAHTPEDAG